MCDHCGCSQPNQPEDHHEHGTNTIRIEQDVLAHNRTHADNVRSRLKQLDARLINVIGSPGCGKTALLTELIPCLTDTHKCVVIEGDLATENDAVRIRTTGAPVHQIQTGTACHLSAHEIEHALDHLPLDKKCLVIVENVGNLVCPSMFDIGETLRIVCLSVTEGTDKPQKYPVSFREAGMALITKNDLLQHVDFDVDAAIKMIEEIKPGLPCLITSIRDKASMEKLAKKIKEMWK
jgi:hydrogenase nickel incorporation protein HypB